MKNKILLVDGNLLIFKSFYGTSTAFNRNLLENSQGIPTHAIHAFFNTLFKVLEFTEATHCYIAFDASSHTKRHELFQEYKAGRNKAPQELFIQMNYVKDILTKANFIWEDKFSFEADDLIATLSKKFDNAENEILIFSSDQDLSQLVNENISIVLKDKQNEYYYKNYLNFYSIHQINPNQIPDFKGLSGDSSDNLKGVAGIGSKTAIKLLNDYSTLENIYQNLDNISTTIKQKLILDKDSAFLCKKLAILDFEAPIEKTLANMSIDNIKINSNLEKILNDLELNIIKQKFVKIFS